MLSLLRWEQGLSSAAERDSLRAMIFTRATDDWQRILGLAEAGRCLALLERDPGQALALVLEAQAMAERHGKEPDDNADTLGMLRMQQGELDEAARLFERARDAARRDGERGNEFMALEHLIKLEIRRHDCARARALSAELQSLAERFRSGSELPFARVVDALCRLAQGEAQADSELTLALDALTLSDAKHRLAFALNEAACLDLRDSRLERARAGHRGAAPGRPVRPADRAHDRPRAARPAGRCHGGPGVARDPHDGAALALDRQYLGACARTRRDAPRQPTGNGGGVAPAPWRPPMEHVIVEGSYAEPTTPEAVLERDEGQK